MFPSHDSQWSEGYGAMEMSGSRSMILRCDICGKTCKASIEDESSSVEESLEIVREMKADAFRWKAHKLRSKVASALRRMFWLVEDECE